MTKHVRVREGNWEYSIPEFRKAEGLEVLDKPALAPSGKPIPPKPVTALGTPAPGSQQERKRNPKTPEATSPGKDAGQTSATPETEK